MIVSVFAINATINATSVIMEFRRMGRSVSAWEPFVWEFSSALVWLALFAVLVWLDGRFPITSANWRRRLGWHAVGAIAFGLAHTAGIVALRKLIYFLAGGHYDFGDVPVEVLYELRKQVWTYVQFLAIIYAYRFIIGRLRGEATFPQESPEPAIPTTGPPEPLPTRFLVKKLGKEFLVRVDDIDWIEASGNYVNLHVGERIYPYRSTMKDMEKRLDAQQFARIHRSAIINVDRIAHIDPVGGGEAEVTLQTGARVTASRSYRPRLRELVQTGS